MKIKKIIIFLIFVLLITSGFQCNTKKSKLNPDVTITVWGVFEERDALQVLFDKFKTLHPTVNFQYKKLEFKEYEYRLLEEWASLNGGPDIYFIPSNLIIKYKNKGRITPMPKSVNLPYREIKVNKIGSFQKVDQYDYTKSVPTTSRNDLETKFPQIVMKDVYMDGKIYGLPLSIETLGMFYNKNMLDDNNIIRPTQVWSGISGREIEDFIGQVKKISRISKDGKIQQSGTALGATENITNASDIIALLLLQSRSIDVGGASGGFNVTNKNNFLSSINFYNDFSNPIKETYSWNKEQSNSLEAFKSGQVAFFFGYPHDISKAEAQRLNFGVTQVPQLDYDISNNGEIILRNPVNIGNYWVMTVSHKTKHPDIAWGFIDFATRKENVKDYLEKSNRPTALKDLISEQSKDLYLAPFVNQILTAKSWYKGSNPELASQYIKELTNGIKNAGANTNLDAIINTYQIKINQTIQ
ncbi:MAG TPA: extracellular solute-binding protein [bacterium]|jgi:ABC-type glycerol-3-phosphate transport system substrate-binding protein|nr:extracellular solute-binding protein [bacterium]HOG38597.1 extracellular solute-binding protein [bacterium]